MEELVLCSIKGDDNAFTKLIQLVQNDLYRVAQIRLDNKEDINDAIQETMLKAYQNIDKLEKPEYFKTWIIRVLINECNKIYEKKLKQSCVFEKLTKLKLYRGYDDIDSSNIENKIEVDNFLRILNYEERLCITLFYNSQYAISEIAEILESKENTIKSRITRAKQKIKKYYQGGVNHETAKR